MTGLETNLAVTALAVHPNLQIRGAGMPELIAGFPVSIASLLVLMKLC